MMKTQIAFRASLTFLLAVFLSMTVASQTRQSALPGPPSAQEKAARASRDARVYTREQDTRRDFRMTAALQREQRKAAMLLLDKAPVLPVADKLPDDEFVTFTRAVTVGETATIENSEQAIRALEKIIAGTRSVTATLRSEPESNEVSYRRYVDDRAPWQNATTNTQVPLSPALYVFRCTDKKSGVTKQQTQNCTTNCTIEFRF